MGALVLKAALVVLGGGAVGLVILQRLVWLAPRRLGWAFYLANVVGEIGPKRLGLSRGPVEAVVAVAGLALVFAGATPTWLVATLAFLLLLLQLMLQLSERRLLTTAWTEIDCVGAVPVEPGRTQGLASGFPTPSTHPQLTVTLRGPFVARMPRLSLGTLASGRRFSLDVVVGNHALTPTQTGVRVRIRIPSCLRVEGQAEKALPVLVPGNVQSVSFELEATSVSRGSTLGVQVEWGALSWSGVVRVDGVVDRPLSVLGAGVSRYPGGCRSAFAWRGDMDLYDTSTFQSVEGLEVTLGLAARYRFPQTMYLSTRLSFDEKEARTWADHYGIDRGASAVPHFIEWVRSHVELRHRAGYPFESDKPYLVELGNHGHLHYGTDTAAAAGNGWRARSRMGAGPYPWQGAAQDSFSEQRDNALETRRLCEELLGFSPRSWAMPDRTRDEHTPSAVEAAGCEVLSDSDVRTRDNVLFQPGPHFAPGSGAVELTKRYPGDPQHMLHLWMNLFWVYRAHRQGIPVVFMCHQHMRLFEGWACARLTEAVLRHVLHAFAGDLWVNTVYGIGVYWRDVLSDRRTVNVEADGDVVTVRNRGQLPHLQVPVDLTLEGGRRATVLVDLDPGSEVRLGPGGIR